MYNRESQIKDDDPNVIKDGKLICHVNSTETSTENGRWSHLDVPKNGSSSREKRIYTDQAIQTPFKFVSCFLSTTSGIGRRSVEKSIVQVQIETNVPLEDSYADLQVIKVSNCHTKLK